MAESYHSLILWIAHAAGTLFLSLPMHVHEPGKLAKSPDSKRTLALHTELFDEVQISRSWPGLLFLVVLFFQDRGSGTRVAGEKQEQIVFKVEARFFVDFERPGFDVPPGRNSKQVMPPKAAMYWSCLPIGSPSRLSSMSHACSASSAG